LDDLHKFRIHYVSPCRLAALQQRPCGDAMRIRGLPRETFDAKVPRAPMQSGIRFLDRDAHRRHRSG